MANGLALRRISANCDAATNVLFTSPAKRALSTHWYKEDKQKNDALVAVGHSVFQFGPLEGLYANT
jgi:hypothetical protein